MENEIKKKGLFFFITALFGCIPISILVANQMPKGIESVYAQKSIPYGCASYHFGMSDDTLTAYVKKVESIGALKDNKYYKKDNLTTTRELISNCYFDTSNCAMRLGRSGNSANTGFIDLTLEREVIGITAYVYTPTSIRLRVNGNSIKSIAQGGEVNYSKKEKTFLPYYFELEQTNAVSISGSGIYLADITFRII